MFSTQKHFSVLSDDHNDSVTTQSPLDGVVDNFGQMQIGLADFDLLPRIIESFTYSPGSFGGVIDITRDYLAQYFDIFKHYNIVRFDLKLELVFKPSWNHTGLIAMYYLPSTNNIVSDDLSAQVCFFVSPHSRVFARVGKDTSATLVIPWCGSYSAYNNVHDELTGLFSYTGGDNTFKLFITTPVPISTIPSSTQGVEMQLVATPMNIKVGGYRGAIDPVTPAAIFNN